MSLMMDQKISAAQTVAGDALARMNHDIDKLKGKRPLDPLDSSVSSSVAQASSSAQIYGMPPNSFVGQTLLPSSVYTEPVTPVPATGQTGQPVGQTSAMVVMPPSPTPLATIPGSVASGRTNEMALHIPPNASVGGAP